MGEYATRDDANGIYEFINGEVGQHFDAIKHEGGALTGSERHNAYVFLDPEMVGPRELRPPIPEPPAPPAAANAAPTRSLADIEAELEQTRKEHAALMKRATVNMGGGKSGGTGG
jgi:hypothetical protein